MPKCIKCQNNATYGLAKNVITHCRIHKTTNMIFLRGTMCKDKTCLKQASFGIPGQGAKFCSTHKESDMVNLRLTKCDKPGCKLRPCYRNSKRTFCYGHRKGKMSCFNSKLALDQEVRVAFIKAMLKSDFD
jgi:hypothetical protein